MIIPILAGEKKNCISNCITNISIVTNLLCSSLMNWLRVGVKVGVGMGMVVGLRLRSGKLYLVSLHNRIEIKTIISCSIALTGWFGRYDWSISETISGCNTCKQPYLSYINGNREFSFTVIDFFDIITDIKCHIIACYCQTRIIRNNLKELKF